MLFTFDETWKIVGTAVASAARRSLSHHDAQDLLSKVMVMIRDECGYQWYNDANHCKAYWINRTVMRATDFVRHAGRLNSHECLVDMTECETSMCVEDPHDFVTDLSINMDLDSMTKILSEYEKRILAMYASGYTMSEVGDRLGCSKATISRCMEHIMKRLELFRRLECEGSEWNKLAPEDMMPGTVELVVRNNQVGLFRGKSLLARGVSNEGGVTLMPISLTTLGTQIGTHHAIKAAMEHMLSNEITGMDTDSFQRLVNGLRTTVTDVNTPKLELGQVWAKDVVAYMVYEVMDELPESDPNYMKAVLIGFSSNIAGIKTKDFYSNSDLHMRGFTLKRMATQHEINTVLAYEDARSRSPAQASKERTTCANTGSNNEQEKNMAKIKVVKSDTPAQNPANEPTGATPAAPKAPRKEKPKVNPDLKPIDPIDLNTIVDVPPTIKEWKAECGGDGYCMGGSGQPVAQRFRPGYDAKLKSALRRLNTDNAKSLAKELGWFDIIKWPEAKAE